MKQLTKIHIPEEIPIEFRVPFKLLRVVESIGYLIRVEIPCAISPELSSTDPKELSTEETTIRRFELTEPIPDDYIYLTTITIGETITSPGVSYNYYITS